MATPAEISAGTNAALPAAQAFIDSFVPEAFQSEVNAKIPQLVAICVENAIPAVDAYRIAHSPTQGV